MWLQESLGGNAKTSLVIAVANAVQHAEETLQSLQFGSRAMRVQTQAVVNECIDFKVTPNTIIATTTSEGFQASTVQIFSSAPVRRSVPVGSSAPLCGTACTNRTAS